MAKKANRKMIGVFVVIAVAILAASVVIFGSGEFFKEKTEYVLYFEESVKGLAVGSPVLFRGVQIGAVKRIIIRSYVKELKSYIPVYIEVYRNRFEIVTQGADLQHPEDRIETLIERGLRAQLVTQSMITGQLLIEVNLHPGTPVSLKNLDPGYTELPTVPSALARLGKSLENLNLDELSVRLASILASADRILKNPDIEASLHELKGLLQDARGLVANVDSKVDPLMGNLNSTISDARGLLNDVDKEVKPLAKNANTTLKDFSKLARNVDAKVEPLLDAVVAAMKAAESALKSIDGLVGEDSPTRADLDRTLQELSGASRSLRLLADYLEQHPDAIIKGKGY